MNARINVYASLLVGLLAVHHSTADSKPTRVAEPTAFKGQPGLAVAKGGRVVRLTNGSAEILSPDLAKTTPLAIEGASALTVLCDGAVLVVGAREVWRVADTTPEKFVKFTPVDATEGRTRAWNDPTDPRRFWVAHATFLLHAELPAKEGEKVKELDDVPRKEAASFTPLPDGKVRWHADATIPGGPFVHLVAGAKDRLWASLRNGTLIAIDASSKTHATVKTGGKVIALAATERYTAAVIATSAAKPTWSLLVVDATGHQVLREALPFPLAPVDGATLEVAIGGFEPIVVVGDAKRLATWDLATKRRLATK